MPSMVAHMGTSSYLLSVLTPIRCVSGPLAAARLVPSSLAAYYPKALRGRAFEPGRIWFQGPALARHTLGPVAPPSQHDSK